LTAVEAGTDVVNEPLSTLAGLISRVLESADQLAASTRRTRKGTVVASTESEATEHAAE